MKRMIVYQSKHEGGGNIENICINVSSTGGGRLSRDGRRQEIEIFWAKATQILTPSVEKITYQKMSINDVFTTKITPYWIFKVNLLYFR
jgi:hypothetical protein